jgi:ketosteroid isomerase-like protein
MLEERYRECSMKRVALTLLLALGCVVTPLASSAELTEAAVRQLIASVDQAIATRDVAGVGSAMSEDIIITVHSSVSGQVVRASLAKSEYLQFLQQAWAAATDYRYQRSNQKIVMQGEHAVVTADVWESMTVDGRAFVTNSRETTTVALVRGKPLAVAINTISSE